LLLAGAGVESVEFAVGFVAAGGRIGDVVGQEFQGLNAGSKSAGREGGDRVHDGRCEGTADAIVRFGYKKLKRTAGRSIREPGRRDSAPRTCRRTRAVTFFCRAAPH